MRSHSSSEHTNARPDDNDSTEDSPDVESLQGKSHGIESGKHTKVKHGGGPTKPRSVSRRRRGRSVDYGQGQVFGHAKEDCRTENCLIVVHQAIS